MNHASRRKKHSQWQAVITIVISSTVIILTLGGTQSIDTTTTRGCAFVTHAFVLPSPTMARPPPSRQQQHAVSSRLTLDVPPSTSSVPPSARNDLKYPAGFAVADGAKSRLSSMMIGNGAGLSKQRRLDTGNGRLNRRGSSYESRYGGRTLSIGGSCSDGAFYIPQGGKNGILGFDVGLHMVSSSRSPSSSASSMPQIDTRIAQDLINPNSPIKKHQHDMSFITNGWFEERNRMRTSNEYGGDGSNALMNRERSDGLSVNEKKNKTVRRSMVPEWFPYLPTRAQILSLKVNQLKDACMERDLRKNGRKAELQERLLTWTREQHKRRLKQNDSVDDIAVENDFSDHGIDPLIARRKALLKANESKIKDESRITEQYLSGLDADEANIFGALSDSEAYLSYLDNILGNNSRRHRIQESKSISSVSKQLEQQKNAVERERRNGVISSPTPSRADLSHLTKTFHSSPDVNDDASVSSNNYQIQQLYRDAKHADMMGDLPTARSCLTRLRTITGDKDTRVLRRLSRLELQCGNYHEARAILQSGLRSSGGGKNDAYLLQGLGNLHRSRGDVDGARVCYKKAMAVAEKGYANPFHALGTLEYSLGNIHDASRVLRRGLSVCPTNHRLHHALGELYREAKMTQLAETEYRKGLECIACEVRDGRSRGKVNTWSKGFFYTALGYLEYERENIDECRRWLWKSVSYDGSSLMYEKGWLALAQLEESEGRVDTARDVYIQAIENYETKRGIIWSQQSKSRREMKYTNIIPARMGDRWLQVYNSWLSMEQNQGGRYSELNNLHSRVAVAFPEDWKNLQRWAKLQVIHERYGRARTLFQLACDQAGSSNAEPYLLFAEFEMSLHNYSSARSILFLGAQSLSQSPDGAMGNSIELSKLYHTWAVCEWHLKDLDRAEILFDHALRLTDSGESGSEIRTLFLYSIARLLFHAREDYTLAQHCICISLSETAAPGLSIRSDMWNLWAVIASKMGNKQLARNCEDQSKKIISEKDGINKPGILHLETSPTSGSSLHQLLRKAPWHHRIVHNEIGSHNQISWYNNISFPDEVEIASKSEAFNSVC